MSHLKPGLSTAELSALKHIDQDEVFGRGGIREKRAALRSWLQELERSDFIGEVAEALHCIRNSQHLTTMASTQRPEFAHLSGDHNFRGLAQPHSSSTEGH